MMFGRNGGLALACLWAVSALAAVSATDSTMVRAFACVPLAIYWPGYAFLRAVGQRRTSPIERHALAAMWSMASLVPGGFLLNAAGLLGPLGWTCWLGGIVALASGVAARRAEGRSPEMPRLPASAPGRPSGAASALAPLVCGHGADGWAPGPSRPIALGRASCVGFALALLVAGAAFSLAIHDARTVREFRYTAFWMVPDRAWNPGAVTIGARNAEGRPMSFDIEVASEGRVIAGWTSLVLEPGESFTREIAVVPPARGTARVEARLFKDGSRNLYRKAWVQIGNL